MNRRFVSILLAALLMFEMVNIGVSAADSVEIKDEVFQTAVDFMEAFSLLPLKGKAASSSVTRGEFASLVLSILGLRDNTTSSIVADGKYLGFNNDTTEKDDWLWIDDQAKDTANSTATPYYDVTTEHLYWPDIRTISQLGLMSGGTERRFRPDERITGNEAIKVLVDAIGAGYLANNSYPDGYVIQAAMLKITNNIQLSEFNRYMTYRDIVVCLNNTLNTNVYSNYKDSGQTFMEYVFRIYTDIGVVSANSFTSIANVDGGINNGFAIGSNQYLKGGTDADRCLGYYVTVYYVEENGDRVAKYIQSSSKNKELTIESDDIEAYTRPYLTYTSGTSKKQVYLGAKTIILYNGKLLDNYTDNDLILKDGSIKFLDNNNDGKYEIAFVDNVEVMWAGGVDTRNNIIYDKIMPENSIDLSDGNISINDTKGNPVSLSGINTNSVLSIRKTIETQGKLKIDIVVSDDIVEGKITEIENQNESIKVDGVNYKLSYAADEADYEVGTEATFYLDRNGKIVGLMKNNLLKYGYFAKIEKDGAAPLNGNYLIMLYTLDDEFNVFTLSKKVVFNEVQVAAENVAASPLIYNASTNTFNTQLIKYSLNSSGEINEILLADMDSKKFVTMYDEYMTPVYRSDIQSFSVATPLFYAGDNTVYINVPLTDGQDKESYFKKSYSNDEYVRINKVYGDSEDSKIARIIVYCSDAKSATTVDKYYPACMVKKISMAIENNEEVYKITYCGYGGEKTIIADDSELFNKLEELEPGDLFRFTTNSNSGYMTAFEKVFDASDQKLCTGQVYWNGTNPVRSESGQWVSQLLLLHGIVTSKSDDGAFINVAPFNYKTNDGVVSIDGYDSNTEFALRGNKYSIFVFNGTSKTVSKGNYATDIMDAELVGVSKASSVVVYSYWGSPRAIFIYNNF